MGLSGSRIFNFHALLARSSPKVRRRKFLKGKPFQPRSMGQYLEGHPRRPHRVLTPLVWTCSNFPTPAPAALRTRPSELLHI